MKNSLFNQTLLKKYAQKFKPTHKQKESIREYIKLVEKGEFKAETKNYINFYDIILKEILGYERENVSFDEKMDEGRGRSEFVLKSGDNKFMIVELKGQNTDLDKKQSRQSDTRTSVDQAFGYAIHTGDVEWILLSNYDEFRLYNYHEKTKYISFNAEELANDKTLKLFLLVFSKQSHLDSDYIDKIREKTLVIERKLENEFYKLYNETRLMLIKELEHYNDFDRIQSVHYAQLILNRYMFICFAEDQGLLPSQITIDTINRPIRFKDLRGDEIWHRINGLFRDVRDGNEARGVFPYDGVLFEEDLKLIEVRDLIDDHKFFEDTYQKWKFEEYSIDIEGLIAPYSSNINPIYKNLLTISSFDFSSDLDVNILGHIFENSIGDIEELKADARGRRKKEGVFYTPEYITDYICRNTIIPYLSRSGKANTVKALVDEYCGSEIEELDQKVRKIKIVDPACGSGAFLNKAADVLLEIHDAVHKKLYDKKCTLDKHFDPIEERRKILLDNIYGVDINEESVEITKLSLFLKVSRKDLKLPNLDNNVKCGNSVIDDPNYAGIKAFNWKNSFKDIFDNGGFDIVIGNPPYGRNVFSKKEKEFFRKIEKIQFKSGDSAEIFSKKCFDNLLKPNGSLRFIIPKKLLYGEPWEDLRVNYLKKYDLKFILDTSKSFTDVLLEAAAFGLKKRDQDSNVILSYLTKDNTINEFSVVEKEQIFLENGTIQIYKMLYPNLFEKIYSNSVLGKVKVDMGYYIPKKLFTDEKTDCILLKGIDIDKWIIRNHRYLKNKDEIKWEEAKKFLHPKIVCQRIIAHIENPHPHIKITACYDEKGILITHTLTSFKLDNELDPKFLLGYLNSKFTSWYAYNFIYSQAIRTMEIYEFYIAQLPIPIRIFENFNIQVVFVEKVNKMLQLNKKLFNETNSFKDWLKHTFEIEKFSKKIEKYYELSLDDFLAELKKKKVDTKSRKNYSLLKEEFEESVSKINPLLQEIEETDHELDELVYELYGLNEEEIRIIEDMD